MIQYTTLLVGNRQFYCVLVSVLTGCLIWLINMEYWKDVIEVEFDLIYSRSAVYGIGAK